jgi:hypothetical protein
MPLAIAMATACAMDGCMVRSFGYVVVVPRSILYRGAGRDH